MEQNKGFFDTYFAFNGRLNRKAFIIRNIVVMFIMLILTFAIILPLYGLEHIDEFNLSVPYFIILFVGIWFYLANTNRRFKDMNKSKNWIIFVGFLYLVQIPLDITKQYTGLYFVIGCIQLALFIYLCAKKGTVGPNKYGPDPLQKDEDIQEEIK